MTHDEGEGSDTRRRMQETRLHAIAPLALACFFLLLIPGCVYFNSYYNAQRYFRQAEKARKQEQGLEGASALRPQGAQYSSRGAPPPRSARNTGRPGARAGRGSASGLYDKAARKASLVLEKYEDKELVDESDLVDDALFILGRAFYWQRDYRDAARSFADLENNFPNSDYAEPAKYWRGLAYEGMGVPSEAEGLYRELTDGAEESTAAKAGLRLGELAFEKEDFRTAILEFHATLEAFPDTELEARLWMRLGESHRALDNPARRDSALASFERALDSNPKDEVEYLARLNRGRVLYEQGQAEDGLEAYTKLLKDGRFRSYEGQTRLLLGDFYRDRDLFDEAIDEFTRVRDDFPQTDVSAMALYKTGILFLQERGERIRAQEYLEEVSTEKRGSEAALLAQEIRRDLTQLDRLRAEIHKADSLAAVAVVDSLAAVAVADSHAALQDSAALDSASADGTPADSTAPDVSPSPAGSDAAGSRASMARGRRKPGQEKKTLLETHFAVAEMYRDRLAMADSAAFFYAEILRRFPERGHRPRALYSLAWVHLDMRQDSEAAGPVLEQLIEAFPGSDQANAGRRLLGLEERTSAEDAAAVEYASIESIMSSPLFQ